MSTAQAEPHNQNTTGSLGGKLAGLSLKKQIWVISLWPFIEQILAFFVSASDLFIASRLGGTQEQTIAITNGMGAAAYIAWLGFVMQGAVAMGSTAVVSRLTGAKDFRLANHAGEQSLLLGAIAGALSCLLMQLTLNFLVHTFLEMEGLSAQYAMEYMRIMAYCAPMSGAVFALNGSLRGSGDTKTPFYIMAGINIINVIVSCTLVWGPEPLGGHGVAGIAWGTVVGFTMGLITLILILRHNRRQLFKNTQHKDERDLDLILREHGRDYNPPLYLKKAPLRLDWKMMWRITRIGGPQSIEIFLIWMIQFYSLRIVSTLPQVGSLGAHMIVIRVESMGFLPGFAIGTAAATLVGQYLGAGNPEAARKVARTCVRYAMIFMGFFGLFFLLFPRIFVSIFASKSPELASIAAPALQIAGVIQVAFASAIVLKMTLRAAGDVKRVMYYSFFGIAFWRVGVLSFWLEYFPETLNLTTIWVIFACDMLTQATIFWKIFRGQRWTKYYV